MDEINLLKVTDTVLHERNIVRYFAAMNDQQHLTRLRSHCLKVMARRKWTQRDLARAAKVSETSLSRILNGVNPQFTKGAKLMAVNPEEGA